MRVIIATTLALSLLASCGRHSEPQQTSRGHSRLGESCSKSDDCQGDARCVKNTCINFCYTSCEICREFVHYCSSPKATRVCPVGDECFGRCTNEGWERNLTKAPLTIRAVLKDGVTAQTMGQYCGLYASPTDRLDSFDAVMAEMIKNLHGAGL